MIKSKEKILEFMRQISYAPLTAEDLIEAIPITGNLNTFWQDLKELQENGEIIKTRFGTFGLPERMGLSLTTTPSSTPARSLFRRTSSSCTRRRWRRCTGAWRAMKDGDCRLISM